MDKLEVARRQLGMALWLFVEDLEPLAVQALACGAGEILNELAAQAGLDNSTAHILKTNPSLAPADVKFLRNEYWNAFKHATSRDGTARADKETLDAFSDVKNDAPLILAWMDYERITRRMPIAAQAFQCWFFALYEEKLQLTLSRDSYRRAFPGIREAKRQEQKERLRSAVRGAEGSLQLLNNGVTEPQLLLPLP